MDGQCCDRHSSARAVARVLLANLGELYLCGHCLKVRLPTYDGEYVVTYETVAV